MAYILKNIIRELESNLKNIILVLLDVEIVSIMILSHSNLIPT